MERDLINEKSVGTACILDLFSPIFKKDSVTLKEVLNLRNLNEQIHRMAIFVPDEIIYGIDLSEKNTRKFRAVLMFLNISGFSTLFKRYIYDKNGGSLALTKILNNYIHVIVREIYCSEGDILKFSAKGLLAAWKVRDGEFMFNVVHNVILRAICIQNCLAALKYGNEISKANVIISSGDVTFSVIGSDEARNFVICGLPIVEIKNARKISLPNDLVLSSSAWQHCTPSQYDYVIKDPYNVKIIKVLEQSAAKLTYTMSSVQIDSDYKIPTEGKHVINSTGPSLPHKAHVISINGELYSETVVTDMKEEAFTSKMIQFVSCPNSSS